MCREIIREAAQEDDDILVRHYRAIWESCGVDDVNIRADAEATVREFIRDGRERFQMAAFLAEIDGTVVGSVVACQLQQLPYPRRRAASVSAARLCLARVCRTAARRHGVARALVIRAVEYLRSSPDAGPAPYQQIGFETATEMRLDL